MTRKRFALHPGDVVSKNDGQTHTESMRVFGASIASFPDVAALGAVEPGES